MPNGDYRYRQKSKCESNLNADYRDTFLREGAVFGRVRIEANNARAKRCGRILEADALRVGEETP